MKEIPLTQGMFALVDDEDYEDLAAHKWFAHKSYKVFYACRQEPVPKPNGKLGQKFVKMHQVIAGCKRPDHKDGNGLNNQKHNLRSATHAQNSRNKGKHKGKSKYKGVSRTPYKWRARIYVEGKSKFLGDKDIEIEAAKLYDEAATKYFGEFARLNFPKEESK